jgi:16S rRNA G966 N2-methylase RsmD
MLRGAAHSYKGSYKERVEGVLEYFLRKSDRNAHAHLDIVGPESASVERLVPIQELVNSRKISSKSPVAETAKTFDIDYALIRGRHLIGPCPAVAAVIKNLAKREKIRTVLDIFAGTGVASKVAAATRKLDKISVVENDPLKVARMRSHMKGIPVEFETCDALEYEIKRPYDLVVADPYFEDTLRFLESQLDSIKERARIFVLVSGGVYDSSWNHKITLRLKKAGLVVRRHHRFGEVILVARHRASKKAGTLE